MGGTKTIKAVAVKGGMEDSEAAAATYTISDNPIAVTGVSVSPPEITLKPDASEKLTAMGEPENATNKDVAWKSDNEDIAKVSGDGTVTAVSEGETYVTVTTADGGKTARCKVTVKKDGPEPEPEKKEKKSSSGDSTPPNPDALIIIYLKDGVQVHSARAAKQIQGPAAQAIFRLVRAPGCSEAFSFNFMPDGKTVDYELKDGKLILFIPGGYQSPGRKFALVALGSDGVHFYPDLDTNMATITVDLDLKGYAFDLVYAG